MATKKVAVKKVVQKPKQTLAMKQALLQDEICERMADGESLNSICKSGVASYQTVMNWLNSKPEFLEKYARARAMQADKMAEDIISIADEIDVEAKYQGEDVKLDLSATSVARNRLRVDARKWLASKMAPKKYGDKLEVDQTTKLDVTGNLDLTLTPSEQYKQMMGNGG